MKIDLAGTFIGIGVGPGDPELITIKAVKALKTVDVICVPKSHAHKPSMALGMVKANHGGTSETCGDFRTCLSHD